MFNHLGKFMKLIKTALAAAVLAAAGGANAGLSFQQLAGPAGTGTIDVSSYFGSIANMANQPAGTTFALGNIFSDSAAGNIVYTYLGSESAFQNRMLTIGGGAMLSKSSMVGATAVQAATVGALDFKFEGDAGKFAVNGGAWSPYTSIALLGQNQTINNVTYDFVLGYNDSANGAADWDDFVIGVSAVPETETYAMMLAGLGLMGTIARRRKQAKAA